METMVRAGHRVAVIVAAALGASLITLASAAEASEGWPRDASGALASGTALVEAEIAGNGHVLDAHIIRTSGVHALDDKALATVRAWTFKPFSSDPGAVPRRAQIPVRLGPPGRP